MEVGVRDLEPRRLPGKATKGNRGSQWGLELSVRGRSRCGAREPLLPKRVEPRQSSDVLCLASLNRSLISFPFLITITNITKHHH